MSDIYMMRNNKKAFTLVEMLVALGLVVAMLAGSGYIFTMAVKAQKASKATSEIMEKLRIVTDQLNSDFADFRKDMPMLIRFNRYEADEDGDGNNEEHRVDQIMFFANGEFESMRQYYKSDGSLLSVKGGIARIQYSLSIPEARNGNNKLLAYKNVTAAEPETRFLSRRQHILVEDDIVAEEVGLFPVVVNAGVDMTTLYALYDDYWNTFPSSLETTSLSSSDYLEQKYEYENIPLEAWKRILVDDAGSNDWKEALIPALFEVYTNVNPQDASGKPIDDTYTEPNKRYHLQMADGISNFKIQLGYLYNFNNANSDDDRVLWLPSIDFYGDGDIYDTDSTNDDDNHFDNNFGNTSDDVFEFDSDNQDIFGIMFNLCKDKTDNPKDEMFGYGALYQNNLVSCASDHYKWYTFKDELPKAIKFTFTIHDERGVIEGGKTFTHIVYIND